MNFTREPIIESVISAREGNKLKLTCTKKSSSKDYLVYAVEVVSFGPSLFYRSNEPGNIFFFPVQDFEIEEVRQARMILKTPEDRAIKIAGGQEGGKSKGSDKKQKNEKAKKAAKDEKAKKSKKAVKASEDSNEVKDSKDVTAKKDSKEAEKEPAKNEKIVASKKTSKEQTSSEKKDSKEESKAKPVKTKSARKSVKRAPKKQEGDKGEPAEPTKSLFSHLLRPPEGLISDNLDRYITNDKNEEQSSVTTVEEKTIDKQEASDQSDDPNLSSEPPKPFEKLEEEEKMVAVEVNEEKSKESESLSIKERMKKVLSTGLKKADEETKE